jgi:hypothetical protein
VIEVECGVAPVHVLVYRCEQVTGEETLGDVGVQGEGSQPCIALVILQQMRNYDGRYLEDGKERRDEENIHHHSTRKAIRTSTEFGEFGT